MCRSSTALCIGKIYHTRMARHTATGEGLSRALAAGRVILQSDSMPKFAITGYLVFAALAFGWRSYRQYRRTGSTGFRGFAGNVTLLERFAGGLFVVAVFAAPAGAVLGLVGTLAPVTFLDVATTRGLGIALYLLGLAGTLWAQLAMGESWRIGVDPKERTRLVIAGPFALARNPIFTAMIACIAGLVLLVPNLLSLFALAVLITAVELHVRCVEEPHLLQAHGEAYRRYAAQTGRFFPGIGRIPHPAANGSS
jgi:protein-S-isoprenylcysteine O-methyltransferase Ste14